MNRADFKEMVQDISRLTRIPKIFFYAYSFTAIATLSLEILVILGLATGLISTKSHAAKLDSCKVYQEKALWYIQELQKWERGGLIGPSPDLASLSAAYGSYYLVCRDLERRESQ